MCHDEGGDNGCWDGSMNGEGHGDAAWGEEGWGRLLSNEWSFIAVALTVVGYVA
jgi:hypothetical protein